MPEQTMQLFEDAVARWQKNLATCRGSDGANLIYPDEFVRVMFSVAVKLDSVSCHALDNETLCFVIGKTETRTYTFLPFHALRVLLAAVAYVFWESDMKPKFNAYGDKTEIVLEIDEQEISFEVETANTGSKILFFRIRKL